MCVLLLPLLAWFSLACQGGDFTLGADSPPPSDTHDTARVPSLALTGPRVLDAARSFPARWASSAVDALSAEVLADDGATVAAPNADGSDVTWDGLTAAGERVAPGHYRLRIADGDEVVEAEFDVVRVGVQAVWLDDDGQTSQRTELLYHRVGGVPRAYYVPDLDAAVLLAASTDGGTAIDLPDGRARPLPEPWGELASPPVDGEGRVTLEGANLPVAFVVGSRPVVRLRFGAEALGGLAVGYPLGEGSLVATVDGYTALFGDVLNPATDAVFVANEPFSDAVDVVDQAVNVHVAFRAPDGAVTALPELDLPVPLRLYAVLGPATYDAAAGGSPPIAWVAVVDEVARAVAGRAADPSGVHQFVVQHVYADTGLTYDTSSGASAYTWYSGDWTDATFDLTAFLARSNGRVVNCSDCSMIVSLYANAVGGDLGYDIILANFALNQIRAIGGTEFTHCPFGPGGCGFSYHAVTSPTGSMDDGSLDEPVYDATLQLDGDADPAASPSVALWADGVAGPEYLDRLTDSPAAYHFNVKGSFR
jgi:hypothetical protein